MVYTVPIDHARREPLNSTAYTAYDVTLHPNNEPEPAELIAADIHMEGVLLMQCIRVEDYLLPSRFTAWFITCD